MLGSWKRTLNRNVRKVKLSLPPFLLLLVFIILGGGGAGKIIKMIKDGVFGSRKENNSLKGPC